MKATKATVFRVLILTMLMLNSCSNPEKDFERCEKVRTEQAFTDFIKNHPDAPLADKARQRIEEIAFEAAERTNTADAFGSFLKRFPTGKLTARAEAKHEAAAFA